MTGSARPPSDQELAHADRVHPDTLVAVLAADLPLLTADALDLLRLQLEGRDADGPGTLDGAVFIDDTGRRQLLCGIWRLPALLRSLSALGDPAGRPIWQLVGGLRVGETLWRTRRAAAGGGAPVGGAVVGRAPVPPWFDCDTEADLQVAKEWTG
jgi:molybdopterin-guanine dinucleotide biosynthesis protein A